MEENNNNVRLWTPADMLEVTLNEPDDFLKIRETLTRIGVASHKDQKLYQSCHILHKQGRYFIVHFKELFLQQLRHGLARDRLLPAEVARAVAGKNAVLLGPLCRL